MLTTRRQALKTLTAVAIGSTALGKLPTYAQTPAPSPAAPTGPFVLPPLPYAYDALEPYIDAETMHLHHDKHHKAYVTKLNEIVAKEEVAESTLDLSGPPPILLTTTNVDDLMKKLSEIPEDLRTGVRNQGGGHANHSLFWQTLTPTARGHLSKVPDELTPALNSDVGGLDKLKASMTEQGGKLFGSGWVWLVLDGGKKLTVMTTPNQDSPLTEGHYPLFGIDVWEHAYYLKYKNVRADYLAAIWNVVNWDFISQRYATAMKA